MVIRCLPIVSVVALIGASGCASGLVCGSGTLESGGQCVAVEDTAAAVGLPAILSFAANVAILGEGESVTFTAVVTHPDGIANLIGGTLMSGSGATYGAFATAGDEGAYSASISWWTMNQINPINLSEGADGNRPFVATFYDLEGDFAQAEVAVGITCEGDASCDGYCGLPCSGTDTGR